MHTLTPHQKAERSRLINQAIDLVNQKQAIEIELKALQTRIYGFAEAQIEAGEKTCNLQAPKGSCQITASESLRVSTEALADLQAGLGARFDDLVKVEPKVSLTNAGRRILEAPQPQEADLARVLDGAVKRVVNTRFTFKPAA